MNLQYDNDFDKLHDIIYCYWIIEEINEFMLRLCKS